MKQILKNSLSTGTDQNKTSIAILILRVAIGVLMLTHGLPKLFMLIGDDPIRFGDPIGIGVTASLTLAVFAEVFCSIFLIFGVATRLSAIPLISTMLTAVLIHHADDSFARKELALLYLSVFVVIVIIGAGKYSIDNWLSKKIA